MLGNLGSLSLLLTEAGNVRYDSAAFHPVCYCLLLSATALGTDDVTGYADVYDLRHLVTSLKWVRLI